jgi:glycosyltransferase involved in cell wall biosynthesis
MVYRPEYGSKASTILLKYLAQWRETRRLLLDEQPDAVFVMSPPVIAALPAFWYAWARRKQVVLDAHTGAFLNRRWRHLLWLQRWLCRRAATTLVHNPHMASLVHQAGGHATLVPDVPILFESDESFPRPPSPTIAVVCSFNYDEPVRQMLAAAELVPDVTFFVTGNIKHLSADLRARVPGNVTLTGFLSTSAYGSLLASADAVMTLTTLDHTMLRGAYEAIYQGTPVIVSDWPILQESFAEGAVHVDNTTEAIATAIRTILDHLPEYREGARRLRDKKLRAFDATRQAILDRLAVSGASSATSH